MKSESQNESQHTPGPWRIGAPPPNGQQTIGTLAGLMVAVATTGDGTPTVANARLIAAAPDLLAALRECLTCEFAVTDKAAISKAEAAIAKAEGGAE